MRGLGTERVPRRGARAPERPRGASARLVERPARETPRERHRTCALFRSRNCRTRATALCAGPSGGAAEATRDLEDARRRARPEPRPHALPPDPAIALTCRAPRRVGSTRDRCERKRTRSRVERRCETRHDDDEASRARRSALTAVGPRKGFGLPEPCLGASRQSRRRLRREGVCSSTSRKAECGRLIAAPAASGGMPRRARRRHRARCPRCEGSKRRGWGGKGSGGGRANARTSVSCSSRSHASHAGVVYAKRGF